MGCLIIIFSIVIQFLIASAVLHLAAYITGHANRGFGTALACTFVLYIVGILLGIGAGILMACLGGAMMCIGLIVGFLVVIYVIQSMYQTSWGYALLMFIVMIIVNLIMGFLFHGAEIASQLGELGIGAICLF